MEFHLHLLDLGFPQQKTDDHLVSILAVWSSRNMVENSSGVDPYQAATSGSLSARASIALCPCAFADKEATGNAGLSLGADNAKDVPRLRSDMTAIEKSNAYSTDFR